MIGPFTPGRCILPLNIPAAGRRNRIGIRPERQRALHQRKRVDRTRKQRGVPSDRYRSRRRRCNRNCAPSDVRAAGRALLQLRHEPMHAAFTDAFARASSSSKTKAGAKAPADHRQKPPANATPVEFIASNAASAEYSILSRARVRTGRTRCVIEEICQFACMRRQRFAEARQLPR